MITADFIPDFQRLSRNNVFVEATVITGLEEIAKEECEEKLNAVTVTSVGRIYFQIDVLDIKKVFILRCIEHIAIILGFCEVDPTADDIVHLDKIKNIVDYLDWKKAFNVLRLIPRFNDVLNSTKDVSFRVTCNRAGDHSFDSPVAAGILGAGIREKFGWSVDLDQFNIEVILNIVDKFNYVAIQLTKGSLFRRNIKRFGHATLKPTVAHALLRLSKIQTNDVVCDPLCGSGSIPIEGAICWPHAYYICGDIVEKELRRTKENVDYANSLTNSRLKTEIIKWDATRLPLKDQTINVVVSDFPFGKRIGNTAINSTLYPRVVTELSRVLHPRDGRAVILSADKNNLLRAVESNEKYLRIQNNISIRLGGIWCSVFLLLRKYVRFK